MSDTVNLAMPFGLPGAEADILSHYRSLEEQTILESTENTVHVFSTDAPEWSSVHAMCRCIAEVLLAGEEAPDSSILSEPAILLKPWLWDFLQMSENSGGGLLPSKILYKKIDTTALGGAIRQELATNERYNSLTASEKTELENHFMNGEVKLLLQSETKVGAGIVLTDGEHNGKRSFDIQFWDYDNTLIDPAAVAEIFSLVGGRTVNDHPFTRHFSLAVWPNIAPLEGGIRFKVEGSAFPDGTTITIGEETITADKIRIAPNRNTLYATLPPRTNEGGVDVVAIVPGLENQSFPDAIIYKTGVVDTMKSVIASFSLYLAELKEAINLDIEEGVFDGTRRDHWVFELETMMNDYNGITLKRSYNGGESLRLPLLDQVMSNSKPLISAKFRELFSLLIS